VPVLEDGEKVQLGGQIAMQFPNADAASRYAKYLDLSQELEYYTKLQGQTVGKVTDVQSLDKSILADVHSYIRSISNENESGIADCEKSLNDKFTRRQMLIGESVDFTSVISSLNDQIGALNIGTANPSGHITTDSSGVFSSYTDGFEQAFDYGKITELDAETLNYYMASLQNAQPSAAIGKVIKSFDWYFCAVADTADLVGLKNGRSIDVTLKDSSRVLKCEIVKGVGDSAGSGQTVLVLKCNELNGDLTSLRLEDIQIRVHKYEGIKVPAEAVHVVNNEKGVYALVSSVVQWRKADVLYTGDNYVILSYDKEAEGGIKLYDQIIVQGKELYDGKVYA